MLTRATGGNMPEHCAINSNKQLHFVKVVTTQKTFPSAESSRLEQRSVRHGNRNDLLMTLL